MRDGKKKKKWKKEGKNKSLHFCLLSNNELGAKKSLTKFLLARKKNGEKEKCTNKGNDKHKDAGSLLHNTTSGIQCLYQI